MFDVNVIKNHKNINYNSSTLHISVSRNCGCYCKADINEEINRLKIWISVSESCEKKKCFSFCLFFVLFAFQHPYRDSTDSTKRNIRNSFSVVYNIKQQQFFTKLKYKTQSTKLYIRSISTSFEWYKTICMRKENSYSDINPSNNSRNDLA